MKRRLGFVSASLVAALCLASSPSAEIYRYVDDAGLPHFTDSIHEIPPEYRDQVRDLAEELEATDRFQSIEGFGRRGQRAQKQRERADARAAAAAARRAAAADEAPAPRPEPPVSEASAGAGGWLLALGIGALVAGALAVRAYKRAREWE